MTRTLQVALADRSYPIYIGPSLIDRPELFRRAIKASQVMIVTNETVGPLYLERLQRSLTGFEIAKVVLPDGEQYKNLEVWSRIVDELLDRQFARDATIIGLGGGVVGDMAGFAAACYQRGVPLIQVAPTLLAQVDSAVGGKTGVNHPLGKNMIGAFYQPRAVVADTDSLTTLPERELIAGIAEVIKYGLIRDADFFDWLDANMAKLLARETDALTFAIERSCRNKAEVVATDELEAGQRALLNLGHTFGHAIETGLGYGTWLHGEAVGAGMCLAADLSQRLGWLDLAALERIRAVIERAGLPVGPPRDISPERLLELMAYDKKVAAGRLRLVLLRGIGNAVITPDFDASRLSETLIGAAKSESRC